MENRTKQLNKIYVLWVLIFTLLVPATCFAQSILWKSEKAGHTLYLMGSIHLLKASHYPLAHAMEAAYSASDVVAFEVDISESESMATQQIFLRKGMFQDGQTLQSSLSTETYQELEHYLATIQLSPKMFNRMKPPLCAMTITIMEMQRLGFDALYGLDKYFSDKAILDGKNLDSFETIAFQLNLFFDQSKDEQELFIKQTLSEIALMKETMSKLDTAWLTGDTETLHSILFESFEDFPEFHERLLLERNRNWISKIKQLHNQNKTTLIVVGAAHLVGAGSVRELLEAEGYRFEQL